MADNYTIVTPEGARVFRATDAGGVLTPICFVQGSQVGEYSVYRNISLSNVGVNIKASAGQLGGWFLSNLSGSATIFFKIYNTSIAPTNLDTPILTIPLKSGTAANVELSRGVPLGAGIGIRATTGVADNDNTAPGANEAITNIFYI